MKKKTEQGPAPLTINVEGYDAHQVREWLGQRIERAVEAGIDRKVAGAITEAAREAVAGIVDQVTKERVTKDIDAWLAEGWTRTDSYGNPVGKPETLRERVRSCFDTKADSYDRQTRVEKWIHEAVTRELATVLKTEVESAQKRLRDAFDDVLKLKFADTMRKMLGVEPK